MDLQTRKLNLIEYLLQVTDEKLFAKIEKAVKSGVVSNYGNPFTDEEMTARAKRASEDYAAGRYMTIDELREEVKKW